MHSHKYKVSAKLFGIPDWQDVKVRGRTRLTVEEALDNFALYARESRQTCEPKEFGDLEEVEFWFADTLYKVVRHGKTLLNNRVPIF